MPNPWIKNASLGPLLRLGSQKQQAKRSSKVVPRA